MQTAMRPSWRARMLAAACFAFLSGAYQGAIAAETAPVEAFGRLPTLERLVISPDGTKLAYVRTVDDQRFLVIRGFDTGEVLGAVRLGDTKLRSVTWINNDNLLTTVSDTSLPPFGFIGGTREWYKLYAYTVSKKKFRPLSFNVRSERTFNIVLGATTLREVGGESVLYAPGSAIGRAAARRPRRGGHAGVSLVGAGLGGARLRRAAAEFSRV
jgi:hypothetical protein